MSWYCIKGEPRWDQYELWTTMNHLYQGGMWFKKKSVLQAEGNYDVNVSADRVTDLRVAYKYYNIVPTQTLPSVTDINNYFYLPASGGYYYGKLERLGWAGDNWSSNTYPLDNSGAYHLYFVSNNVYVDSNRRHYGFTVNKFE